MSYKFIDKQFRKFTHKICEIDKASKKNKMILKMIIFDF